LNTYFILYENEYLITENTLIFSLHVLRLSWKHYYKTNRRKTFL